MNTVEIRPPGDRQLNKKPPEMLSIWIVDRAPNAAEHVGSLLRNAGLRVRTRHVPNGASLAQALAGDRPDLLICPESGGPVSLEEAVEQTKVCQPPIPVVALGEAPDAPRMAHALALGAVQLIDGATGELLAVIALRELARTQEAQQHMALGQEIGG